MTPKPKTSNTGGTACEVTSEVPLETMEKIKLFCSDIVENLEKIAVCIGLAFAFVVAAIGQCGLVVCSLGCAVLLTYFLLLVSASLLAVGIAGLTHVVDVSPGAAIALTVFGGTFLVVALIEQARKRVAAAGAPTEPRTEEVSQ